MTRTPLHTTGPLSDTPSSKGTHRHSISSKDSERKREARLLRLGELRSYLDRLHASFVRPCSQQAVVKDLTRLVNVVTQAIAEGETTLNLAWLGTGEPAAETLPSECWIG